MGTINAPFGLRPIGRWSGSLETMRQYPIASAYGTNIAMGDVVQLVDNGALTSVEKQSSTGDTTTDIDIIGIFMGCRYTDPNSGRPVISQLWPASTVASDAMAYVVDDPTVHFVIQASAAASNTGDIYGKNSVFVQTAPNTSLRISRVALDISGMSTDNNNPIRIIDYLGGHDGDERGSTYPLLVCKFNYTQMTNVVGAS
jgi:hypothetical protein